MPADWDDHVVESAVRRHVEFQRLFVYGRWVHVSRPVEPPLAGLRHSHPEAHLLHQRRVQGETAAGEVRIHSSDPAEKHTAFQAQIAEPIDRPPRWPLRTDSVGLEYPALNAAVVAGGGQVDTGRREGERPDRAGVARHLVHLGLAVQVP